MIIWHPDVYRKMGNELAYMGVSSFFHKRLEEDLLRNSKEIPLSLYVVFGPTDFIIRLNAPPYTLDILQRDIEMSVRGMWASISLFRVNKSYMFWGRPCLRDPDLSVLDQLRPDEKTKIQNNEMDQGLLDKLQQANLILAENDNTASNAARAFMFVALPTQLGTTYEQVINEIMKIPNIKDYLFGLHTGTGFGFSGNILLELSTSNTEVVYGIVLNILSTHQIHNPKTTTFIVAEVKKEENKEIFSPLLLAGAEPAWQFWIRKFPTLEKLESSRKVTILLCCEQWSKHITDLATGIYVERFILALIEGNLEQLVGFVIALNNFLEGKIRDKLILSSKEKWPDDWKQQSQAELGLEAPLFRSALSTLIKGLKNWQKKFGEELIPENLIEALFTFSTIRNNLVHKKEKEYTDYEVLEADLLKAINFGLWDVIKSVERK